MRVRKLNLLNAAQLKAAREACKAGRLIDGGGLVVETKSNGRQYFHFRVKTNGKSAQVGLGSALVVTLASAREVAADLRPLVEQGMSPKDALAKIKTGKKDGPTFRDVAKDFIAKRKDSWSEVNYRQWVQTMRDYVYPVMGDMHLDQITIDTVVECLMEDMFWYKKTPTASKTQRRIASVMGAGRAMKLYEGSNPAVWEYNLQYVLPAPADIHTVSPHEALDYHKVTDFMLDLEKKHASKRNPPSAKALYWLILSGTRYMETAGARFDEIQGNVWTIPASRMKTSKEFKVPLTPPMLVLLDQLKRERVHDLMFPSLSGKGVSFQPLSANTITKFVKENMGDRSLTTHGFRSTFKTWTQNETEFDDVMTELCLSHIAGDSARKAYARGAALKPRRKIMEAWASYCLRRPISTEDGLTLVS